MPRKPSPLPEPASKSAFRVRSSVVPVSESSTLSTVGPDWEGWGRPEEWRRLWCSTEGRGDFVRVRPPPGVPPAEVARVKKWLEEGGARARVEAAREPDAVPREAGVTEDRPHARAREVVEGLLSVSRSTHREELAVFVRARMDESRM